MNALGKWSEADPLVPFPPFPPPISAPPQPPTPHPPSPVRSKGPTLQHFVTVQMIQLLSPSPPHEYPPPRAARAPPCSTL